MLVFLGVTLFTCGCSTVKMYDGPELPEREVAIIQIPHEIVLLRADRRNLIGRQVLAPPKELRVLSGPHWIQVLFVLGGLQTDSYVIGFNAKLGSTYRVLCANPKATEIGQIGGTGIFWIEEAIEPGKWRKVSLGVRHDGVWREDLLKTAEDSEKRLREDWENVKDIDPFPLLVR